MLCPVPMKWLRWAILLAQAGTMMTLRWMTKRLKMDNAGSLTNLPRDMKRKE
jgi:hypothetical protein